MNVRISAYLFDILTACQTIEEFLAGRKRFDIYEQNKLLRRAIEREIEIIGEATNRILKLEPDFPLTNARQIVNTRNTVIHAYDALDNATMWGIVINHLPRLKAEVETLLRQQSDTGADSSER